MALILSQLMERYHHPPPPHHHQHQHHNHQQKTWEVGSVFDTCTDDDDDDDWQQWWWWLGWCWRWWWRWWWCLRWFIQLSLRHQLPPSFPLLLTQVTLRSSHHHRPNGLLTPYFHSAQFIFTRTNSFSPGQIYFHFAQFARPATGCVWKSVTKKIVWGPRG